VSGSEKGKVVNGTSHGVGVDDGAAWHATRLAPDLEVQVPEGLSKHGHTG
jgi:hypothetical protein